MFHSYLSYLPPAGFRRHPQYSWKTHIETASCWVAPHSSFANAQPTWMKFWTQIFKACCLALARDNRNLYPTELEFEPWTSVLHKGLHWLFLLLFYLSAWPFWCIVFSPKYQTPTNKTLDLSTLWNMLRSHIGGISHIGDATVHQHVDHHKPYFAQFVHCRLNHHRSTINNHFSWFDPKCSIGYEVPPWSFGAIIFFIAAQGKVPVRTGLKSENSHHDVWRLFGIAMMKGPWGCSSSYGYSCAYAGG